MTDYHVNYQTEGTFTPDELIAGGITPPSLKVTVLTGQNLVRGSVLGKITASGKYILSLSGAVDGSEVPDVILAHDVDATAADQEAMAYTGGIFNADSVTWGGRPYPGQCSRGLAG